MKTRLISRRRLLYGACAGAVLVAGGTISATMSLRPSSIEPDRRRPLRMPPVASSDDALIPAPQRLALVDEGRQQGLGYNGSSPGPTFRMRRGTRFAKTVENRLGEETTVHWHGLIAPPEMDGHPADAIAPGRRVDVTYPIDQRASLNWYHPHPHKNVASQVWLGLAGLLVIEDDEEDALDLPSGDRELMLVVRDARVSGSGNFTYSRNASGREGDFPMINGVPWPRTRLPNQWVRLRLLNGANARVFRLTSEAPLVVIGNDGGLLEAPQAVDEIDVSPGERVDILMDMRGYSEGDKASLRCAISRWTLLDIDVVGSARDDWQVPARLSRIKPLRHPGPPDRVFRFEDNRRINDREYDMALTDFVVPFGKVERWRFESHGGAPHPVHVHGAHFQIQSRDGGRGRVMPWETGWKDTVLLRDGEAVEVLIAFERYEGRYLLHCHKLEHEDHGMMMNFIVSRDLEKAGARAESERLFGPLCSSTDSLS